LFLLLLPATKARRELARRATELSIRVAGDDVVLSGDLDVAVVISVDATSTVVSNDIFSSVARSEQDALRGILAYGVPDDGGLRPIEQTYPTTELPLSIGARVIDPVVDDRSLSKVPENHSDHSVASNLVVFERRTSVFADLKRETRTDSFCKPHAGDYHSSLQPLKLISRTLCNRIQRIAIA
jgi:hypothetical protein